MILTQLSPSAAVWSLLMSCSHGNGMKQVHLMWPLCLWPAGFLHWTGALDGHWCPMTWWVATCRTGTTQSLMCYVTYVINCLASIFTVLFFSLRFIQGAEQETPYVFYHWEYIDIFNYFSHQMVTIPPVVWTNAAHKHGVLSIGECLDGFSLWAKILVLLALL